MKSYGSYFAMCLATNPHLYDAETEQENVSQLQMCIVQSKHLEPTWGMWVPGVIVDPLCFLAGCRKRRLKQAPLILHAWPHQITDGGLE